MTHLILKAGGLCFRLNFKESLFFKQFKRALGHIPKKNKTGTAIEIDVFSKGKGAGKKKFSQIYQSKNSFWAFNEQYQLCFDKINSRAIIYCARNTHILKNALRLLIMAHANEKDIFLHASSAKYKGRATIFCGPSGSGKTTITKLLPRKFDVIGDDLSIIKKKNGFYYAFGDSFKQSLNSLEKTKVKEVLFLKKANRNQKVKISRAKALALILTRCPLTEEKKEAYNRLKMFNDFVGVVPTYIFKFKNDHSLTSFFKRCL